MRQIKSPNDHSLLGDPWRLSLLLLITIGSLAIILSQQPIGQEQSYHQFADRRDFFGIPNALNVCSNLPFLAVGLYGIRVSLAPPARESQVAWSTFFVATTLVSFASAGYHWNPTDTTLAWDRLPMAICFMSLLVAILGEYVSVRLATYLLVPAVLLGIASVGHWHLTGDLRFYAWVQFFPLLIIPSTLLLFRSRYTHRWCLLAAFACYLAAKIAELFDGELLALSQGVISGHSLKHLLAAAGLSMLILMLKKRRLIDNRQKGPEAFRLRSFLT